MTLFELTQWALEKLHVYCLTVENSICAHTWGDLTVTILLDTEFVNRLKPDGIGALGAVMCV